MQFTPTQKRLAAWLGIALLAVLVLWLLKPVLTPFVVAAVLAYALNPLVNRFDRMAGGRMPRLVGVVVVETLFMLAMLGLVLLIIPILAKEVPQMRAQIPSLLDRANDTLAPLLAHLGIKVSLDIASIKDTVLKFLSGNVEDVLNPLLASIKLGGSLAMAVIGNAFLIPVALFYLLLDWNGFVKRAVQFVPLQWRDSYDSFMREADEVLGQYLRGQGLVMLILAVFYSAGLMLFGLELAVPIGVFTGLAVFVPFLGFGLGLILALVSGLLQFAAAKALVMVGVVYGAGQVVESVYLTPRLLGERIGLHPLVVIFALMAFGQLFGFVGVLIALPVSAVLLVAWRRITSNYFASKLYRGQSPQVLLPEPPPAAPEARALMTSDETNRP